MAKYEFRTFILTVLSAAILIQIHMCSAAPPPPKKESQDEFAQQAADALDSTLLFLKNSFNTFVMDSTHISNLMANLTDNVIKLAPQGEVLNIVESQRRLQELSLQANKTLAEGLFTMDD